MAPYDSVLYHDLIWDDNSKSPWTTALKQVEIRTDDGSGPHSTRSNGKRTAKGENLKSAPKYSSGWMAYYASWPIIISTSALS